MSIIDDNEEDGLLAFADPHNKGFSRSSYLRRKPGLRVQSEIPEDENEDDLFDDDERSESKNMNYDYKIIQSSKSANF